MKKIILALTTAALMFAACEEESTSVPEITLGDYPVKEYYIERNPSVNPWGAAMNFVHDETTSTETELDLVYMTETSENDYDIKFYTVKAYYTTETGDLASNGCPAMLLDAETQAYQIGKGLSFFDSLTVVTDEMIAGLSSEDEINYSSFIDASTGYYDKDLLYSGLESCIIGQSFRSDILVVPDDSTEEEEQAVYLVKTKEDAYVKFMVKTFKPESPNDKKTLVRWQVISE